MKSSTEGLKIKWDKIECRSYLRKIAAISYEDTQSYQITKMFINDRRQILRHLFEE